MLLFIWDYDLLKPFPITTMPDYQAYRSIAQTPGDFAVLELPIGVRTGFAMVGRGEYSAILRARSSAPDSQRLFLAAAQ